MQREWSDPRDRRAWLVTLSPFGYRPRGAAAHGRQRFTISFHRPGLRPIWTTYCLTKPVQEATDQELMDLLDVASAEERRREERPAQRRRPSRAEARPHA